MIYPQLVPKRLCKTPIKITLYEESLAEDGSPIIAFEGDLLCNYQDTAKTVYTADKKQVQLSGIAMFNGDICPNLPTISGGEAEVFGTKREILQGTKARNSDGSVNFCELRLV